VGPDLDQKIALVTGAGAGIGEACARRLAAGGARVAIVDRDLPAAGRVAGELDGAVAIDADVSDPMAVDAMVAAVVEAFGRLDIAINNAGIGGLRAPIAEQTPESWREVLSVNLDGVFYCIRAELPAMLRGGGGAIVNIASVLSVTGFEGSAHYVAAKHGVLGLTQNAALEYATQGIRVNAVAPGFIATPLLKSSMNADEAAAIGALHPQNRLGEPEEVAELVAWLASDAASFVNGSIYPVDGAYLAR
jgi:NAD(P)-dependent dehydrogenase (short-subunit alcohol dehydrogenase family)